MNSLEDIIAEISVDMKEDLRTYPFPHVIESHIQWLNAKHKETRDRMVEADTARGILELIAIKQMFDALTHQPN